MHCCWFFFLWVRKVQCIRIWLRSERVGRHCCFASVGNLSPACKHSVRERDEEWKWKRQRCQEGHQVWETLLQGKPAEKLCPPSSTLRPAINTLLLSSDWDHWLVGAASDVFWGFTESRQEVQSYILWISLSLQDGWDMAWLFVQLFCRI